MEPISKRIEIQDKNTIYSALVRLDYSIGALCGGKGTCGKCKILCIDNKENLSPLNSVEKKLLTEEEQKRGTRLACQCKVLGNVRIMFLEGLVSLGNKILVESDLKSLKGELSERLNPEVRILHLNIPNPTMQSAQSDIDRLVDTFNASKEISHLSLNYINENWYELSKTLPASLRTENGKISVYYWDDSTNSYIIDVEPGHHDHLYGLAVDLGTTTIVGYLINLQTGKIESISSMLNPQVTIGEDLITRISYI